MFLGVRPILISLLSIPPPANTELSGEGIDTSSIDEQFSHLVQGGLCKVSHVITRSVERLDVYDMSTDSTLYSANGFITSNCRCSFIPANVGEDSSKQKRSRDSIKAAMKKSILAEAGKNKKGRTYSQIKARSKWAGADREIAKKRPKSILED